MPSAKISGLAISPVKNNKTTPAQTAEVTDKSKFIEGTLMVFTYKNKIKNNAGDFNAEKGFNNNRYSK